MEPLAEDDPAEIGGYRLRARLGAGAMGRVYLASTPGGRAVALKVIRPEFSDDPESRARLQQEVQAAQRVHGSCIAELVDANPDATPPWLVTAYVAGPSLAEAVEGHGPMPVASLLRLIAGVAEALQAIHAAGVVHRDLKPSNVILAQDGPRVTDFGIARALDPDSLASGDIAAGSLDFLAPEQVLNVPASPATDVFALGSLAVYAAVGRPPFGRGDVAEIAHRVAHEPPDLEGLPAQLLTLVESCLDKQAKVRPTPDRVIDFCATRVAEMTDSSQPWPAWSLADDAPQSGLFPRLGSRPAAAPRGGPGEEQASAGTMAMEKVTEKRGHFRLAAAVAATALAAAAVVIAAEVQPGTGDNAAATTRGVSATHPAGASAARVTASAAISSPAPSRAPSPSRTPSHSPAAVSPARSSSAPAPLVLLSQGSSVTASSVEGYPWAAANAADGNPGTRWSSAWSDPQWIEVDLGAAHAVRKVTLDWENPAYATAFQLQVSVDGTTWTDVYSTTTGTGGKQAIAVNGTGRYVRMYGTQRNTRYGYSLWEFQVYGS